LVAIVGEDGRRVVVRPQNTQNTQKSATPTERAEKGSRESATARGRVCRMRASVRLLATALVALATVRIVTMAAAAQAPERPRIYGIAFVTFRISEALPARTFYESWLRLEPGDTSAGPGAAGSVAGCQAWRVGPRQQVLLETGLKAGQDERLVSLGFVTESPERLRSYLQARGLATTDAQRCGRPVLRVSDPEGHVIEFVGPPAVASIAPPPSARPSAPPPTRILHAGLSVRDVTAMDRFYVDVLGFSEIWRGGRSDATVDWINMKTPDGTEYIEYMLIGGEPLTRNRLGSMHHVALVVDDMQDAYESVLGRVPRERWRDLGSPRVGRNRRWQLNLFDPDGTRTELMERHPMRN